MNANDGGGGPPPLNDILANKLHQRIAQLEGEVARLRGLAEKLANAPDYDFANGSVWEEWTRLARETLEAHRQSNSKP